MVTIVRVPATGTYGSSKPGCPGPTSQSSRRVFLTLVLSGRVRRIYVLLPIVT